MKKFEVYHSVIFVIQSTLKYKYGIEITDLKVEKIVELYEPYLDKILKPTKSPEVLIIGVPYVNQINCKAMYYTLEKDYDLNEIDAFFAISKESVTLIVEGQIIGSVNISD